MTTLSKEDVVVHPYWKSCTTKEEIIIALTANASAGDSGAAMRSDVTDAINRAIQLARADLVAENDRLNGYIKTVDNLRAISVDAANKAWIEIDQLRTALAAAEADNERLREVIFSAQTTFDAYVSIHNAKNPPDLEKVSFNQFRSDMCSEALAQPRDDSALREMIAGVYEECVKGCRKEAVVIVVDGPEERAYNNAISDCEQAIRALAEKAKGE